MNKRFAYENTDQYKLAHEEYPSFSPDPTHYWKNTDPVEKNIRPEKVQEEIEVKGKSSKVYYMPRKRTDYRIYKPMNTSVF